MIGAGTGLAPFRGFIQERALRRPWRPAGPGLLFFGCDHPDVDFLYREELDHWERDSIVQVYPALYRQPDGEILFVQHRLWKERERVGGGGGDCVPTTVATHEHDDRDPAGAQVPAQQSLGLTKFIPELGFGGDLADNDGVLAAAVNRSVLAAGVPGPSADGRRRSKSEVLVQSSWIPLTGCHSTIPPSCWYSN